MGVGFGELLVLLGVCAVVLVPTALGAWLLVTLIRGTQHKTKMGINLSPPSGCPKCGEPLPALRAPKNLRQALWGGWTCRRCQTELDKWGRVLGP